MADGLDVRAARTVAELERLAPLWERVPWQREEAELDYLLARVRHRPEATAPFGLVVVRDGEPVAGAAGRFESRRLLEPGLRVLRIVDGGIVADDGSGRTALVEALTAELSSARVDALMLPALPVDSELDAALAQLGGPLERQRFVHAWPRRELVLPGSFEEFLASRSHKRRARIRREAAKLEQALGDELAVAILREPSQLEQLVRDLDRLAGATYQRTLGAGFADTPEQRELARLGLERGWTRAYVLYRGAEPLAYWLCSTYRGTILLRTTGFDPAWAEHQPGVYLLMRVIEDACADPALERLDFGPGDADYKRRYASDSRQERNLTVFAPTFRGRRVNLARNAILGARLLARRALDETQLTDRVRSRLRGRGRTRGTDSLAQARRLLRNAQLDLRHGAFLGGSIRTRHAELGARDVQNSDYADLPLLFAAAGLGPDDVVCDVGCGKGRVLNWLLANHGGRIYGIELDEEVCAATAKRLRRRANVTILCGDATALLPDEATVFYLFNPFDRSVMDRFAQAVLALPPRPRRVVYYRAKELDAFRGHPRFRVRELDDPRLSHASAIVEVLPAG
jgi:CelD/BcsL family acetyltransferase involved in cellulose biosynthesis